jgi:hypothetical protein
VTTVRPAPDHRQGRPGRRLGPRGQRRGRLHADELILVKPGRGPVQSPAVLPARQADHATHKEAGQHPRLAGTGAHRTPAGWALTSDLSAQDFYRLLATGAVPVAFVPLGLR